MEHDEDAQEDDAEVDVGVKLLATIGRVAYVCIYLIDNNW